MMKIVVVLVLAVWVYCAKAEICQDNATVCVGTTCVSTADHVHIQCVERHCTCSMDPKACLSVGDCNSGKCFDRDGHSTTFHCLDGACKCLRV